MVDQPWHGLLLALVAFQLAVAYYAYRTRNHADDGDGEPADVDADSGVVECRNCGAENDRDYRYCRSCVATLPTATEPARRSGSPLGRSTR